MVLTQLQAWLKSVKQILFLLIWAIVACTPPMNLNISEEDLAVEIITPSIVKSDDGYSTILTTDPLLTGLDSLSRIAQQPISWATLLNSIHPELHDSTRTMFGDYLTETLTNKMLYPSLTHIENKKNRSVITYAVDTSVVLPQIRYSLSKIEVGAPMEPLFDRNGNIPDFSLLNPTSLLMLPCEGLYIPKKASRLPNAPRAYRAGVHRGIDFFSNWGTPVIAVADGIIIRSDLHYEEVPADFRIEILKRATRLNRTPSDIFNMVLLGKAVVIDHGFNLFPGYRSITIYAHLSYINSNIKPGYSIKAGDVFAQSGNTGTQPGTMGTREESHLHWELILQDAKGEYYFGQNLPYETLYPALKSIFDY